MYYRPVKSAPKIPERFAAPIKQLIEADPSFGYRTVAGLLQFNKKHGAADLPDQGMEGP